MKTAEFNYLQLSSFIK